jgi:hypothetical protein
MKIVRIFADQLFSFHYNDEDENELERLLQLWRDVSFLYQFVTENQSDAPKDIPVEKLINQIIEDANDIDDVLIEISEVSSRNLEEFFRPLHNLEYNIVRLSKQKGRKSYLRIYAIKIDHNCFVITGGAIKFHHLNDTRPHTKKEMDKITKCRDYLNANNVFDVDSFYEFLNEEK